MKRQLLAVPALVVSLGVLTACGASAPPAKELADELIDTMEFGLDPETQAAEIESIRGCMHDEVADFGLSESDAQGFEDFDDVAAKAADGQERALQIMADFEQSLAACN